MNHTQQPEKQPQPSVHLSHRQLEIARMVAEGHSNKIIADNLGISYWTVQSHLKYAYAKYQVTTRAALIARLKAEDLADGERNHRN